MGGSPTLSECVDYDESDAEEKAEAPQVEESTGAVANPPRSGSSTSAAAAAGGAGSPGSDDSDCERKVGGRPHLQRISADEWRRSRAARASSAATAESAAATSPAAGAAPDANRGASDVDPEAVERVVTRMVPGASRADLPRACDRAPAAESTPAAASPAAPRTPRRQAQPPPSNSLWIEDSPDRMRDSPDSPRTPPRQPQVEMRDAAPRARSPGMEGSPQEVFSFNGRPMTILDALEPVVMTARQLRDFRKICSREGRGRDDMNGLPYVLRGRETRHELEERFWAWVRATKKVDTSRTWM
ncbi:hypothetical protein ATCC90586_011523 [Pythium insidiosum]|nr:hypothetical protein ATCC90586_011523 [Pythium insidiosum]